MEKTVSLEPDVNCSYKERIPERRYRPRDTVNARTEHKAAKQQGGEIP